jgi:hypothetical protein
MRSAGSRRGLGWHTPERTFQNLDVVAGLVPAIDALPSADYVPAPAFELLPVFGS